MPHLITAVAELQTIPRAPLDATESLALCTRRLSMGKEQNGFAAARTALLALSFSCRPVYDS